MLVVYGFGGGSRADDARVITVMIGWGRSVSITFVAGRVIDDNDWIIRIGM